MNCYFLATVLLSEAHNVAAEQNTAATYALVQIIHNNSVRALSACARLDPFSHILTLPAKHGRAESCALLACQLIIKKDWNPRCARQQNKTVSSEKQASLYVYFSRERETFLMLLNRITCTHQGWQASKHQFSTPAKRRQRNFTTTASGNYLPALLRSKLSETCVRVSYFSHQIFLLIQ